MRFEYKQEDINELLAEGSVDWNHDKKAVFETQAGSDTEKRLPENTSFVLVDPNGGQDKAYYAKAGDLDTYTPSSGKAGWMVDFAKFSNDGKSFSVQSINDVIASQITVTPNSGSGNYTAAAANDYSVYTIENGEKHYYKYVSDSAGEYDLAVEGDVYENYYISMYVPGSDDAKNSLYFYTIKAPDELEGSRTAKVDGKTMNILVSDLYTQETTKLQTTEVEQITSANRTIQVRAQTAIKLNNEGAASHLSTQKLYHSFLLTLNRYTEGGVTNEIFGLSKENIKSTYKIDSGTDKTANVDLESNYLNIKTAEIMERLRSNKSLTISSVTEMTFDDNELDLEFPTRSSEQTSIGVNVAAKSNLAYSEDRLVYTSMSKAFEQDSHYYYIESVNSAKLVYEAVNELDEFDINGKASENKSRLGINGKYSLKEYMPINTKAMYNVSNISDTEREKAKNLRVTLTLSKKTDIAGGGAEYVQVEDMAKYLRNSIQITSGDNYSESKNVSGRSLVVDIPIEKCDYDADMYDLGIGFLAKTGDGFHEYANYKVTLKTELLDSDGETIENSSASNYIVYTNAKAFQLNN